MIDWPALKTANAPLNAFVDFDEAAGSKPGSLSGVTVGVKSNLMVKGLPWTGGMAIHRDRIAARDAEVVAKLRDAGALISGTLNMHEAALGATTDNVFFGRTHNPHRPDYTPGGSSGGSGAAVAAGLCDAALGTDTLGSVRIPAAYCGVYGLKPTHGAISNDGLAFLEPSFDCIGPLARSLAMLERIWSVIGEPAEGPTGFKRLLRLDNLAGAQVEQSVCNGYERALSALDLPAFDLCLADGLNEIRVAGLIASGQWLIADLAEHYQAANPGLSDGLKFVLNFCAKGTARPDILSRTRETLCVALGEDGVLLLPTAPQPAFSHDTHAPANQADFTCLANVAGLPALALPAGWSDEGLPVSVQLVGPAGSEASLFALARLLDAKLAAYRPPANFGF